MTMTEENPVRVGSPQYEFQQPLQWQTFSERIHECRVALVPEEAGGFSAYALRLPGVMSQGETVDEAIANITDAFRESMRAYEASGDDIPWEDISIDDFPRGFIERWILVDV